MFVAYVVLTVLTAAAMATGTYLNYTRHAIVVTAARHVRVPLSWTVPLGTIMGVGALGLLAGFAVPPVGTAAASGLVLYFVCAMAAHFRVGDLHLRNPVCCLALTSATLAVTLAHRGLG